MPTAYVLVLFMTFHKKSQVIDLALGAPKEQKQVTSEGETATTFLQSRWAGRLQEEVNGFAITPPVSQLI